MDDPKLLVVNQALNHLGQNPVTSLQDADLRGSQAAKKILRFIDQARDVVLADYAPLCALSYDVLEPAVIPGFKNWKYAAAFYLPGDCLRVWSLWDGDFPPQFDPARPVDDPNLVWEAATIEDEDEARQVVLCSISAALNVCYVRRAGWGALVPLLLDAVSYETAARACGAVTSNDKKAGGLFQAAQTAAARAASVDATQQGGQAPVNVSSFLMLRRTCW